MIITITCNNDNNNYYSNVSVSDPAVHGILVQLPLPTHIDEQLILNSILPTKDVDGLHPLNVAQLANTKTHAPGRNTWSFDTIGFHVSCTPQVYYKDEFFCILYFYFFLNFIVIVVVRVALSCWIAPVS